MNAAERRAAAEAALVKAENWTLDAAGSIRASRNPAPVGLVYSPAAVSEIRREHLKDAKEAAHTARHFRETAQVHALLALSAATQEALR